MFKSSATIPGSQCFRIAGACVLAATLGLAVADPFKEAVGMNGSCREDQTPATLIIDSQSSDACVIAMSAFE